uniref:Uncharacterized protein n=1 Tax=Lepeophtheirus salmonis TaxID=72036 RepID=A0A0K2TZA9_LEPSM
MLCSIHFIRYEHANIFSTR